MVSGALRFCLGKTGSGSASGVKKNLRAGDALAHSVLRYGLARQISDDLTSGPYGVSAVYVYGSTMEDRARATSDIDLLVIVRKKGPELLKHINELKPGILGAYKKLAGNAASGLRDILDVHIADEGEVRDKKGYASLVTSPFTPVLRLSR